MNDVGIEVFDLVFGLQGRSIALDYVDRLWLELSGKLPWLADADVAGVHPLAGVSAGDTELYLTRRARLTLRLPLAACEGARGLVGATLDLGGKVEVVGAAAIRALQPSKVLHSRFVEVGEVDEQEFLASCVAQMEALGVSGEMVVGRAQRATMGSGELRGFGLMLHGLRAEDSLRLQREGLGRERRRCCGIFVPHKAVAAVDE